MTVAEFFFLLCVASCVSHGDVIQVPMSANIVSYTRPVELLPKTWYNGKLYILVPESET